MKKYLTIVITILTIGTVSCRKFVEVDTPSSQLVTKDVYESNETAISALTGCYARISAEVQMPYIIALYTGYYSDELKNNSTTPLTIEVYANALNSSVSSTFTFWNTWYRQIYHANAVYEGCANSGLLNEQVKKQLMAEARFIRAFLHLNLSNLYGDIPLALTTDYTVNSTSTKTPINEVYKQVISDLIYAIENLSADYVAKNSISASNDRIRPNKAAARALLARAYLYNGNYPEAEAQSTLLISDQTYVLGTIANTFQKVSKEAIWQLQMPSPNPLTLNTWEGANFPITKKPAASGNTNTASISTQLLSAFEPGDQRRNGWIGSFLDVSVTPNVMYNYPNKYKAQASQSITEWTQALRLAEQYLIRAESRVQQNKLSEGKADLKILRARAGLGDVFATDKAGILNAILHERQIELFCEWGHRWIDLKRFGSADTIMETVTKSKGGQWSSFKKLWPIPDIEIQNNRNLLQNTGYN